MNVKAVHWKRNVKQNENKTYTERPVDFVAGRSIMGFMKRR